MTAPCTSTKNVLPPVPPGVLSSVLTPAPPAAPTPAASPSTVQQLRGGQCPTPAGMGRGQKERSSPRSRMEYFASARDGYPLSGSNAFKARGCPSPFDLAASRHSDAPGGFVPAMSTKVSEPSSVLASGAAIWGLQFLRWKAGCLPAGTFG